MLRSNFAQTLRVAHLAKVPYMRLSSFHQHFKALTLMTPLPFQKELRFSARLLKGALPRDDAQGSVCKGSAGHCFGLQRYANGLGSTLFDAIRAGKPGELRFGVARRDGVDRNAFGLQFDRHCDSKSIEGSL